MVGEKILVIDDSPLVRKLAEVSLQEAGYEVYTAADGEEGLKLAEETKPDLILVDFIIPKMTGSQVCRYIRESETLKDVPIILITGKGETVGQTFIEKYGILHYFIKPFKSEELVEKINQVLGKTPEIVELQEEVSASAYDLSEIEVKEEEETEPLILSETEAVLSIEEKEVDLLKEIDLKESLDILEQHKIEISENVEALKDELKIEEVKPLKDLFEEPLTSEVEEIKPEEEIQKEEISTYDLISFEKLIDDKFNSFFEKITSIIESSVEGTLKKYGLIKDSSLILSGNLNFFKISEIFDLINSNGLDGILSVHGKGIVYEFLFMGGQIIYGISNLQKQKIGFKLFNEMTQEDIRNITIEALNSIKDLKNLDFIFEKKDFSDKLLTNRIRYNPSNLFKETLKMI